MEKNLNAIFYDFKYYLLPEDTCIDDLADGVVIRAKRLREEGCLAPDFVRENVGEETLEIADKNLVFPVEVNIYTQKEYDEILVAQIKRVCHGCSRYADDGNFGQLDGHHREISLDGVCYEREDSDSPLTYAARVNWFYCELSKRLNELAECIEYGRSAKFNKICKSCSNYIFAPANFYGTKRDGKYFIYMECSFCPDIYLTMLAYTAHVARYAENPLNKAGWSVIPFIPDGADGYNGRIKGNTPVGRLVQSEIPWKYYLKIRAGKVMSDKAKNKLAKEVYAFIAFRVGEDVLHRTIEGIETECDGTEVETADEVCEKLLASDEELPSTFPPSMPYGWEDEENTTPFKKSVSGVSSCFNFANICADPKLAEDIRFSGGFAYAYLFVPAFNENTEAVYDAVNYYLENEQSVPEPVLLKDSFVNSFITTGFANCTAEGEQGWAFDAFVADENAFYRFLKILAPVLSFYGAKLVVVNEAGINAYACGKEILPLDGTESN